MPGESPTGRRGAPAAPPDGTPADVVEGQVSVSSPALSRRAVTGAALAALAAAVALGVVLAGSSSDPGCAPEDDRGLRRRECRTAAPPLSGPTLDGTSLDLETLRGRVVVLNIWGSWCGPCKKEQPDLVRAAADLRASGVEFVGINVRDSRSAAQAHARRYAVEYPSFFDEGFRLVGRFREVPPAAVPSTILLDRGGRVAGLLFGSTDYAEITALARSLAAETA